MINVGKIVGKTIEFVLNIPRCTHDIPPHSSWYPPGVLTVSPGVLTVSPCVLNDIPPVYCTDIMQGDHFILILVIPKLLNVIDIAKSLKSAREFLDITYFLLNEFTLRTIKY